MKRVFLAYISPIDMTAEEIEYNFQELENLVNTHWWAVVVKKYQKRAKPDYKTFIGKWKLQEIKNQMEVENIDLLIVWNNLKSGQIYNIEKILEPISAKVWDRIDLIIKIFEKHAQSTESRLQTELAAIKHMGPRIFGMGLDLSRQWWWIWTRWKWETNIQIMKRHLKESEKKIKQKLQQYQKTRKLHRTSRQQKWLKTVWIVGYTNAGKSSLLNALTDKWVIQKDELFATLGTNVGSFFVHNWQEWKKILLNDTIWFISNLPPELVDAFSSTLEDSIESDLLLHIIDSYDKKICEKIKIVDDILLRIWANQKKIYVFNKIDLLTKKQLKDMQSEFAEYWPICISAEKKLWLDKLKHKITKLLKES